MAPSTRVRKFTWQDLDPFTPMFNEVKGTANTESAFDVGSMRQFLSHPSCRAEKNGFVAETDGALVGFVLVSPELPIGRACASGGVVASHRNRGIGSLLLKTAIEHSESLGASVLHIHVSESDVAARHLMEREDFRVVRTYWDMRREGTDVPSMQIPSGFSLRSFRLGQDEEAVTRVQNAAFGGNWGFCPNTVEEISAKVKFSWFDPEGIIIAVGRNNDASAYNWTSRTTSGDRSTGKIEMMGVHPDHRGEGLGKAVLAAGLRYLIDKGVTAVELEADSENVSATGLYSSQGFRTLRRTVWYEKPLRQ